MGESRKVTVAKQHDIIQQAREKESFTPIRELAQMVTTVDAAMVASGIVMGRYQEADWNPSIPGDTAVALVWAIRPGGTLSIISALSEGGLSVPLQTSRNGTLSLFYMLCAEAKKLALENKNGDTQT